MIELTLLTGLTILVVLTLRRGKPVVLDNPLIIQRVGKYHFTLAPQLNQVQTLGEHIAKHLAAQPPLTGDSPTLYFSVLDPKTFKQQIYLLAATVRHGVLYLQAIHPQPLLRDRDSHLDTVRTFATAVLAQQPPTQNNTAEAGLNQAIDNAAQELAIQLTRL
jgi:hypothetical protein